MTGSEISQIVEEIKKLGPGEKGPYEVLLVVRLVRDVAYYVILGVVAWALGRRIVGGFLAAWKESRRVGA